ncbi:SOS response-associated peptidase [Planctomycetes bacterium K23_9]|uniref:Abasic site processing protein n=1 Tax=Stieleria marina TaxID=1930275 RepID=A0A517NNH2_9BACT|nr:Putative SOS response-associated peptidase YedK [Planctomycetes bacterium K23_9]
MFLPHLSPDEIPELPSGPRYNIAPTQLIATVVQKDAARDRQLALARWGLLPSWAEDFAIGARMINARSETADSKPSFKNSFLSRRCLIPADGYYEWAKTNVGKQPYLIEPSDGSVAAMAGLWSVNKKLAGADEPPIVSCTILTTLSNQTTSEIHDRMPVFLDSDQYERWLSPEFRDVDVLKSMLRPAADDKLKTTPVSARVGNVWNDDSGCVAPVTLTNQQSLF